MIRLNINIETKNGRKRVTYHLPSYLAIEILRTVYNQSHLDGSVSKIQRNKQLKDYVESVLNKPSYWEYKNMSAVITEEVVKDLFKRLKMSE